MHLSNESLLVILLVGCGDGDQRGIGAAGDLDESLDDRQALAAPTDDDQGPLGGAD